MVHRLIRALPLTGSLLQADTPGLRPRPLWTDRVGVATSAGVQFKLEPSFSVDESSSESSNMRSLLCGCCCCCCFWGDLRDMDLSFLGPGRRRGLDSSADEAALEA